MRACVVKVMQTGDPSKGIPSFNPWKEGDVYCPFIKMYKIRIFGVVLLICFCFRLFKNVVLRNLPTLSTYFEKIKGREGTGEEVETRTQIFFDAITSGGSYDVRAEHRAFPTKGVVK